MNSKTGRYFHKLMQSLYYPAVLGTAFVLVLFKMAEKNTAADILSDVSIWYAFALILFYSLSFLINEETNIVYNWKTFICDLIEVVLIFFAFYYLGFFEGKSTAQWDSFFACMACIVIDEIVWNKFAKTSDPSLTVLGGVVFLAFSIACFFISSSERILVWVIMIMFWIAIGFFFYLTLGRKYLGEETD